MTVELFLYLCKRSGLDRADMEIMTIGMCLDYIEEYINQVSEKKEGSKGRKPTQTDFDIF